jgi:hypothetical protein
MSRSDELTMQLPALFETKSVVIGVLKVGFPIPTSKIDLVGMVIVL